VICHGPWTSTLQVVINLDGSGNGQSSNFWIKGVGLGETNMQGCTAGGSCIPTLPLGIAGVSTVELIAIDSTIDNNPNTGGGKRYYPDKQTPTDNTIRKRVRVRATLTLPAPNFLVLFRSYDMDDPSSNAGPVDPDTGGANSGGDNRGTNPNGIMSLINQTGTTNSIGAVSNASGVAEADLWTTMNPGDNFKVAAAGFTSILDGLTIDGTTLNENGTSPLPVDRAASSDLLTVWRKINLEVDNMTRSLTNREQGVVTTASHVSGQTVMNLSVSIENGRFVPGRIVFGTQSYAVYSNTSTQVIVNQVINLNKVVGKSFTVYDDDDYDGDNNPDSGDENDTETLIGSLNAFSKMQTSDSVSSNLFVQAYIMPVYNGGGNSTFNGSAPAALNVAFNATAVSNQLAAGTSPGVGRNSSGSDEFWVGYIQVAYQGDSLKDLDPIATEPS
jgi:hypothetical protein